MLVINTYGDTLVNISNILAIYIDTSYPKQIIARFGDDNIVLLGEYETIERTKEVFEMLVKTLTYRESKIFKMPEK